jgi:hypothetical protein
MEFFRPTGKSVWMGRDLARTDDWIFSLPQAALADIDAALPLVEGLEPTDIRAEDFPLPSLAPHFAAWRAEIESGRGFIIIRGLPADKYSLTQLKQLYWAFGLRFGVPVPQSFLGDRIGDIMDVSDEEPDPRKRRGYHSGGLQHTHTDSSDIVSMLSIRTAKAGGASRLASAHAVHNLMLDTCPGLLQKFYEGFFLRGTDTDAAAAGRPALSEHRIPAFTYQDGWLNCAYVRGYVDRAVRAGDVSLSPEEQAAVEAFAAFSNHAEVMLDIMLLPGDMQFFNNRTVLHGRAHFEDHPEKALRRHLLRLWLTVPAWPRLARVQDKHSDEDKQKWAENARKLADATA